MPVRDASPPKLEDRALSDAWVRLCPAARDENDDGEESDSASEVNKQACACGHVGGCIRSAPLIADPAYQWIISKKGIELAQEWTLQQQKRCQDNYNMHIFNDWNGYGISEVIENIVCVHVNFGERRGDEGANESSSSRLLSSRRGRKVRGTRRIGRQYWLSGRMRRVQRYT